MRLFKKIVFGGVLAIFSLSAQAVVIEQAPLDGGDGGLSVVDAGAQLAESFQFSSNVELNDISWWGSYTSGPQPTESFTVRVFADDSGEPATTPLFETAYSGNGDSSDGLFDLFGGTVYRYDVSLVSPLSLFGGIDYYLSVINNDANDEWWWLQSNGGDNWARVADADSWSYINNSLDLSYRLTAGAVAQVPEPGPMLLMSLPLFFLVARLMRKQ